MITGQGKMDKEFNLSDYIQKSNGMGENTIQIRYVKEFIKRLKKRLDDEKGLSIGWTQDLKDIIDELCGEKLK